MSRFADQADGMTSMSATHINYVDKEIKMEISPYFFYFVVASNLHILRVTSNQ